ncbi:hypothetical protein CVT26_013205 [Gymnopilus dilepis]|uniref:Hydrophobin n=1 Tax=Gymnopilus dilepis TaxID=231916 RepID=A0A409VWG4_9AGAR|nr:hypothetical protein CVT26_013205 [Gymnopilus dilepis]
MRASAFFALALPILAAATALPRQSGDCDTGDQLCCNQVQQSSTETVTELAGLLGIALPSITALVGLSCSPLSILGFGGNSCSAQPVCCTSNNFSHLPVTMRFSTAFAFALPILAAATALPRQSGDCDTGSITCCNQVQSSSTEGVSELAGLLGIDLGSLGALVGPMRTSAVVAFALPVLAAATAIPRQSGDCDTGPIQCCNSLQQSTSTNLGILQGLLGLLLPTLEGLIGLNCSPLSILGGGGNSCSQQPVCCENNQFVISFITFILFACPLLAAASAIPRNDGGNCDTGSIQCCNATQQSSTTLLSELSGLLGLVLPDITGLIGLSCSPLSILGAGGNSCSAQPVCCTDNSFNGLIALGCNPININL